MGDHWDEVEPPISPDMRYLMEVVGIACLTVSAFD
jgi:hypothetical protein